MSPAPDNLAALMAGFRSGDKDSTGRLMELLYPELRRLAAAKLQRERNCHSWQPTLLVNELYLELVKRKALGGLEGQSEEERQVFLGLAGFLMHRLLILHSRPLRQRAEHVGTESLDAETTAPDPESLQTVEQLLARLEAIDPKLRTVVELRVFEGLTHEEIAARLGCSVRTIGTCWTFAKRWLQDQCSADV